MTHEPFVPIDFTDEREHRRKLAEGVGYAIHPEFLTMEDAVANTPDAQVDRALLFIDTDGAFKIRFASGAVRVIQLAQIEIEVSAATITLTTYDPTVAIT